MLAAAPDNFAAHHGLGVLRAQQGQHADAIKWLGAALALDPAAAPAWVNYGNVLGSAGRLKEALESYDRALAIRPDDCAALLGRARTLADLRRLEEALRDYDAVLAVQPDDVEALNDRGNVLRDMKRFEAALAGYEAALSREPRLVAAHINRGVALSELRRQDEALASYDAALALQPDCAPALNNRGFTLRELGRLGEALADYDKALAIAPDYPAALNNRAKALCELGRLQDGFADFRRSAALAHGGRREMPEEGALPHKTQHDKEQREYIVQAKISSPEPGGDAVNGPAINPGLDLPALATVWQSGAPKRLVIDDFLTAEALNGLRRFCWNSDIWQAVYSDGYLGAFPEQGFACPLLAQIAGELRTALPPIFGGHPLRYFWAFKYDGRMAGTAVHADEAAVNVNFWITPDDANLDPASGGLVIWDTKPPPDWDFARYNGEAAPIRDFLARSGAKSITVPYRANRAVVFDSDLFHETGRIRFKDGYCNRRINITLLYGRRAGERKG
jgi:tetratricopeptide (TPR) repeat protein